MTRRRWIADTWTDTTAFLAGDQPCPLPSALNGLAVRHAGRLLIDEAQHTLYADFMTIQLTAEQEVQLTSIAATSGKSLDTLVSAILASYVNERTEALADLARARADMAAGRVLSWEKVWERLQKRFAAS